LFLAQRDKGLLFQQALLTEHRETYLKKVSTVPSRSDRNKHFEKTQTVLRIEYVLGKYILE